MLSWAAVWRTDGRGLDKGGGEGGGDKGMRYRHQGGSGSGLAGSTEHRLPFCPLSGQSPHAALRNHGLQGQRQKRQQSCSSLPSKEVSHTRWTGLGRQRLELLPILPGSV